MVVETFSGTTGGASLVNRVAAAIYLEKAGKLPPAIVSITILFVTQHISPLVPMGPLKGTHGILYPGDHLRLNLSAQGTPGVRGH